MSPACFHCNERTLGQHNCRSCGMTLCMIEGVTGGRVVYIRSSNTGLLKAPCPLQLLSAKCMLDSRALPLNETHALSNITVWTCGDRFEVYGKGNSLTPRPRPIYTSLLVQVLHARRLHVKQFAPREINQKFTGLYCLNIRIITLNSSECHSQMW